jgi:nucleoside-diphosphate-sugar epimerase
MELSSKILILGGTQLLGRDTIENLLNKNMNNIIYANRGLTNPNLFPDIKHIKYDRNKLEDCSTFSDLYDYVIDFSCYTINQFINTISNIKHKKYIYISTMSVFDTKTLEQKDVTNNYYWYCLNKSKVEEYIKEHIHSNLLIIRPCAIYGEYDYTNRFYKKDNQYYFNNTSNLVNEAHGHMFVRDFTNKFLNLIDTDTSNSIKEINILT